MKAVYLQRYGGPEVLELVERPMPVAGPGEMVVRNHAIGFNYLETKMRQGEYYKIPLPGGIGQEAVGIVESVGPGVTDFRPGDRVAYLTFAYGSNAEVTAFEAFRAVRLPDSVSFETAAATYVKGMTAQVLLKRTYPVKPGDDILVWAAAGAMGQHLVQWGSKLGARVIGVVGSEEKMQAAKAVGAEHVLVSSRDDIAKRVRELTGGKGVEAVYDAIGKDSAEASMNSLAPLGTFVNYGSASGHPDPVKVTDLSDKGSLFYTRAVLQSYIPTPAQFKVVAEDVMDALGRGILKLPPPTIYRLADVQQVHRDVALRKTTGSLVMVP